MKARLRCERPHQDCENEPEKPDHPVSLRDSLSSSTERGFRHTQVAIGLALHTTAFIQDVMTQYAQPRPWILLREGEGATCFERHAAEAQPRSAQRNACTGFEGSFAW